MLLVTLGCQNSDGSLIATYSSCHIEKSDAFFSGDKDFDEEQCWELPGDGIVDKLEAEEWCIDKIDEYMFEEYGDKDFHEIILTLKRTYCPDLY